MKYELILSDFDGTLLRNDLTVDKSVADAIRGYINRGGHFVVCTGRMAKSMDGWLDYLGIGGQRIAVVGFNALEELQNRIAASMAEKADE